MLVWVLFCIFLDALLIILILTANIPKSNLLQPYFSKPWEKDGLLDKSLGINTLFKYTLLFLLNLFVNFFNYLLSTYYNVWRWDSVISVQKVAITARLKVFFFTIVMEFTLNLLNFFNIFVTFTNYSMIFNLAFARAFVALYIVGKGLRKNR